MTKRLITSLAALATANAVSLKDELQEQIRMIDEQEEGLNLVKDSWEIKSGHCLQTAEYQVFDLKQFERAFKNDYKDKSSTNAGEIEKYTHRHFQFKICQEDWSLTSNDMKAGKCLDPKTGYPAKANGFLSKYDETSRSLTDSECQFSFGDPMFKPIKAQDDAQEHHDDFVKGFELTFVTQDPCMISADKNVPYTYTYEAICDRDGDNVLDKVEWLGGDICSARVKYVGPAACSHIDSYAYYNAFKPLSQVYGFVVIIFGIALLMVGARFFEYSFATISGILVFTVIMYTSYSLNLFHNDKDLSINSGLLLLFCLMAVLVASWIGYYSRKFAHRYASVVLCAWIAGTITIMGLTLFSASGKVKLVSTAIAAVCGAILGKIFRKEIRVVGTAMIGAFLVTYGIGQYIGGYPSLNTDFSFENNNQDISIKVETSSLEFLFYIALMAGLAIFGSYYQFSRPIDDEDFDETKNPLIQNH